MSPENEQPKHAIEFAGQQIEPYRENVFTDETVLTHAMVDFLNEVAGSRTEERIVEYRAILGYFEEIASDHDGVVPIEDIRTTLIDLLKAKK